ncbi:cold-shock protein [Moellerella wisconsensis]|uniref:Cold shock protein n=3 Tax=Moellerella wisconsensis TaxID=158849 RepID=A0A0N0Z6R0_9GAMM|nr:cold shock domain-containing protein [Moellerella wisconsensis]KLN97439.1 cold-shock protein [Moellerella wisconsensis]KPD01909.1 cold shock protein [Moellerella wisconsensis ATCC 35017]UNH25120.1 cold shock domain-containing protein [Moellerella wisconsensis]UNH28227.1 cold shock domain-containing protein [Moellerella wisconsensis]UNH31727.1 cold shock domain-containing protein [Moellerella wisconsensis]
MNLQLHLGRVKWFDQQQGYGFISPSNGGDDIYVTRKSIANTKIKSLMEGQNVEFSVTRGSTGITAADVIAF